jgi:putative CocE/NonD family hydrolase
MLVLGPWTHGSWTWTDGDKVGNIDFASKTGVFFRKHIEYPFFEHLLKGKDDGKFPKAWVFETGTNRWRRYEQWPPREAQKKEFWLQSGGRLGLTAEAQEGFDEYSSDPKNPVPYLGYTAMGMRGDYMTEDQRFAAQRPDVLTYETEVLREDVKVSGPVGVSLLVSTSGTDSDFVVKLIDVYPGNYPDYNAPARSEGEHSPAPATANAVKMGGYQQLVRGEPFRGKFRHGFEKPVPFEPGRPDRIEFSMPDVCHVFRKGHRIMVQVQSSWFPLTDLNPQKFVEIPHAAPGDFRKAEERVYRGGSSGSRLTLSLVGHWN